MADRQAEAIKYETEVLKYTALIAAGIAGGSLGLVLGERTILRLSLAGMGFITTIALAIIMWRIDRRIRAMIAQIREPV
jgi:hypothetical protein